MVGKFENELGNILIEREVVAKIAGLTAVECYGIVGMASKSVKDGIVKLLGVDKITRGINVEIVDNMLDIDLHIIVEFGTNISAIGESLMSTVKYKVEHLTGLKVNAVNILVEGIRVE